MAYLILKGSEIPLLGGDMPYLFFILPKHSNEFDVILTVHRR